MGTIFSNTLETVAPIKLKRLEKKMLRYGTTVIPIISRKKLVILSANGEKTNWEVFRIAWTNSMSSYSKPSCLLPEWLSSSCPHIDSHEGFWETFKETHLLLHPCYFGPSSVCQIGQIGLLMMPSPRYCTPPSLTLTAKMATMSGCYSLTITQLSTL